MVDVELARTNDEVDLALGIAEEVWGTPPISVPVCRALSFAGWYVAVARVDGEPVGMCAGFVGVDDAGLHLHSHLAAVRPEARGRGIGRRLKHHQRDWCLGHGIETVTWTFDPLVRDNARFNLHHLGATGDRYLVELYGEMDDDINRGQPSDRLLIRWDLRSESTERALAGSLPVTSTSTWEQEGAERALRGDDDAPVVVETSAPLRLVATPSSITELRRTRPALALDWRFATRTAMTTAFADGLRPASMTDDGSYLFCAAGPA